MSDAPLPLGYIRAIEKAAELRRRGTHWSWPTIADTMEHYHGFAHESCVEINKPEEPVS